MVVSNDALLILFPIKKLLLGIVPEVPRGIFVLNFMRRNFWGTRKIQQKSPTNQKKNPQNTTTLCYILSSRTSLFCFRMKLFPELLITHMGTNCPKKLPGCFLPASAPTSETFTVPRLRAKFSKGLFEVFKFHFLFYILTTKTLNSQKEILLMTNICPVPLYIM